MFVCRLQNFLIVYGVGCSGVANLGFIWILLMVAMSLLHQYIHYYCIFALTIVDAQLLSSICIYIRTHIHTNKCDMFEFISI